MRVNIRRADGSWYTLKLLRGPKGDKGEQGDPGTGLELLDAYETLEELKTAHPTGQAKEVYAVGSNAYIWSETLGDWRLLGALVGPAGQNGADGTTFTPDIDEAGYLNWTNDGGRENPEPVKVVGKDGNDGVGVQKIEQTTVSTEDGGTNVIAVTLTDGTVIEFTVRNGSKGSTGAQGEPGETPTSFPASAITGVLGLANGGTGVQSLAALKTLLGISDAAGFVTGTYTGNASISTTTLREVALGFRPSFVIVWSTDAEIQWWYYEDVEDNGDGYMISQQHGAFALDGHPAYLYYNYDIPILSVTSNGFTVRNYKFTDSGSTYEESYKSYLNASGTTFCYIAGK